MLTHDPFEIRIQTHLFIRTRQNQQMFGVIPFVKLQNDYLNNN